MRERCQVDAAWIKKMRIGTRTCRTVGQTSAEFDLGLIDDLCDAIDAERTRADVAERAFGEVAEQNDLCHQPAANYELLLARLDGTPTNHGSCRVAAKLDELEAENQRMRAAMPDPDAIRRFQDLVGVQSDYEELGEIADAIEAALAPRADIPPGASGTAGA